jgi:hypothetical protein
LRAIVLDLERRLARSLEEVARLRGCHTCEERDEFTIPRAVAEQIADAVLDGGIGRAR